MKPDFNRVDCMEYVHSIATFGDAQLVRHINGRYELRGGSAGDHTDAKEWISLFFHDAVVSFPSPVARRTRSTGLARRVSNAAVRWVQGLRFSRGLRRPLPHCQVESKDHARPLSALQRNSRKAKA